MKSLRTLLKLARRDLETLRRALAEQVAIQTAVHDRMLGHEQTIKDEQVAALRDYESSRAYGGYAAAAIAVRHALAAEHQTIGLEIDRLRALIAEAHVETRKFERLLELEGERAKKAADKREMNELDEFATMTAARTTRA
jgi:flagellar biosynthesis chaperone FliJ